MATANDFIFCMNNILEIFPSVNAPDDVDFALKKGEKMDVNNARTYDNCVKVVRCYLLTLISIDINNYQKELVDSGYIKAEDQP
jgi:ABC-type xylose transport system substrate-binding protein